MQKLTLNSFEGDIDSAPTNRPRARRKSDGFEPFDGEGPRPRRKSSAESFDSLDSFGDDLENAKYDGAPHPKPRRKSNAFDGSTERTSDAPHRPKQRRKSYGGGAGADSDKKERRMRKEGKNEDGDRRRRSLSRSRRKPRRGSTTKER